ncbi:MAG: hypothetical protein AAF799_15435 [Myxococcota bacterium]
MRRGALCLGLLLGFTGACKDETPAPASTKTEAEAPAEEPSEPKEEGERGGSKSGLAGLTSQMIDEVRQGARDPILLLPSSAYLLVSLEPGRLLDNRAIADLWEALTDKEEDLRKGEQLAEACLGALETFERVVVAGGHDDRTAMAIHGKRLGDAETWRCFERISSRTGDWDLKLTGTERGEGPQLLDTDDGDRGYFPDKDTAIILSKELDAEVVARIDGKGTAITEGPLAATLDRTETDRPLWFVGLIEGQLQRDLADGPFDGFKDFSFSMGSADDGIALTLSGDGGTDADATRLLAELEKQFNDLKGMLPMLGLPASIGEKIEFKREGSEVLITLDMTRHEVEQLTEAVVTKL